MPHCDARCGGARFCGGFVIRVTKLNGRPFIINADLIESIEEAPDTILTLTTRNRVMVKETADEVIERIIAYYRTLRAAPLLDAP